MSTLSPRSVDPNNVRGADTPMQSMDCKEHFHGPRSARSAESARGARIGYLLQGRDFQADPGAFRRFVMLGLVDEKPDGFALTELGRQRLNAEQQPQR
jgi:hypothetical protein